MEKVLQTGCWNLGAYGAVLVGQGQLPHLPLVGAPSQGSSPKLVPAWGWVG